MWERNNYFSKEHFKLFFKKKWINKPLFYKIEYKNCNGVCAQVSDSSYI